MSVPPETTIGENGFTEPRKSTMWLRKVESGFPEPPKTLIRGERLDCTPLKPPYGPEK